MTRTSSRTKGHAPEPIKLGIALSGGGVRSASFSFGVIQYLSRFVDGWLAHCREAPRHGKGPRVPRKLVLSTVSGGGWAGASAVFAMRPLMHSFDPRSLDSLAVRLASRLEAGETARAQSLKRVIQRQLARKEKAWLGACKAAAQHFELDPKELATDGAPVASVEAAATASARARDVDASTRKDEHERLLREDATAMEQFRQAASEWSTVQPLRKALDGGPRALRDAAGWSIDRALDGARTRARMNASYLTPVEGHGGVTRGTSLSALLSSYLAGLLVNLLEFTGITTVIGCSLVALLYALHAPTRPLTLDAFDREMTLLGAESASVFPPQEGSSREPLPPADDRSRDASMDAPPDAGAGPSMDAGTPDAGAPDAGTSDAGADDLGASDAATGDGATSAPAPSGIVVHGGGPSTLLRTAHATFDGAEPTYVIEVAPPPTDDRTQPPLRYEFAEQPTKCTGDFCYFTLGILSDAIVAEGVDVGEDGVTADELQLYACHQRQAGAGDTSVSECVRLFGGHSADAIPEMLPSSELYFYCTVLLGLILAAAVFWDRSILGLNYRSRWIVLIAALMIVPPVVCALSLHAVSVDQAGMRFLGALWGAATASAFVLGGARGHAQHRADPERWKQRWLLPVGYLLAVTTTLVLAYGSLLDQSDWVENLRQRVEDSQELADTAALAVAVAAFPAFWVQFAVMSLWALLTVFWGVKPNAEDRDAGRGAMVFLMLSLLGWCVLGLDTTAAVHLSGELVTGALVRMQWPSAVSGQILAIALAVSVAVSLIAALPKSTGASRARAIALSLFGVLSLMLLLDVQSWILANIALAMDAWRHGPLMGRPGRVAAMDAAIVSMVTGTIAVLLASMVRKVLTRGLLTPHYVYRDRIRQVFVGEESCSLSEVTRAPDRFEWVMGAASNAPEGPRRYELGTERSGEEPAPGMSTSRPWLPKARIVSGRVENLLGSTPVEKALAVSAAAIAPLMGVYGDKWIWWLASLLNLRLGARLPSSTATHPQADEESKRIPVLPIPVSEIGGQVYVTDGGHLDNSGLDALIRRRCAFMIVIDGEQDGPGTYAGLAQAVRLARLDGVDIDIDLSDTTPGPDGFTRSPCAVGRVIYPAEDGVGREEGILVYIKPTVSKHEPVEVRNYRLRNPAFPHESTSNQFFDAEQFDAYRQLGYWSAERTFLPALTVWNGAERRAESISAERHLGRPLRETFEGLRSAWRVAKASDLPTFLGLTSGWISRIESKLPHVPHRASGANPVAFDEPTLRADLQKLQHMEQVFEACRLWQTLHFADNAGWLQLFYRYWESPSFREVWTAYNEFFSSDFCQFAERVLDYSEERAKASGP